MRCVIKSQICFAWLRRSGTFWASIALIFATLFSWSTPALSASKSVRARETAEQPSTRRSVRSRRAMRKRIRVRRTASSNRVRRGRRIASNKARVRRRVASNRVRRTRVASNSLRARRSQRRWIEVNLSKQRLIAWEGGRRVYSVRISSGKRSTPTRVGTFRIQSKHRTARMRGRDYNVPNVPYTMYYSGGYAIHGAYWHNRFGTPVSHGCVNVPVAQARKLYSFASHGTKVVVRR
ncbi:L,D-transpeptidase [Trichocoleus sp. Lan]